MRRPSPAGREVDSEALLVELRAAVGRRHVLVSERSKRRYCRGFRTGNGDALAVVRPATLTELWRVVTACAARDAIVVMQSANTGLTGGSTPHDDGYDRDAIVINTLRMDAIQLIDGGRQVLCMPGATLDKLERILAPLGREPHSVIGSSCLGASVVGGVCNNSGGALVRRGPAYTELALFARLDADGTVSLVNHLGIDLGNEPEEMLSRLEKRGYPAEGLASAGAVASDPDYHRYVRDVDAGSPARFNADPRRLFEASGSAGRLIVFAVRLDTFPASGAKRLFYIGTDDAAVLADLRTAILRAPTELPVSAEYLHRDMFDIAARYGKDSFYVIRWLGTTFLPALFALKSRIDSSLPKWFARNPSDRLLQALSRLLPDHLPPRMRAFRDRYPHHLLVEQADEGIAATREMLEQFFQTRAGAFFECSADEHRRALLHRFVAAGAAIRYRAVHPDSVEDIVAIDVALPRNCRDWEDRLPPELEEALSHRLYYGHFLCHVFHQDYIVRKGRDVGALKEAICRTFDARGGKYPAEHNVGHVYAADAELRDFYRELDPANGFNPGIGRTSRRKGWR